MAFTEFKASPTPNGSIQGYGSDEVGKFEFSGSFNNDASSVRFKKHYIDAHDIYY